MRYIDKSIRCTEWDFFIEQYGQRLKNKGWDKFLSIRDSKTRENVATNAKCSLRDFLWTLQRGLCIYCLQNIPFGQIERKSHIEHLKPKSRFRELTFEYFNLALSCNGFDCSTEDVSELKEFCGHYKDNHRAKSEVYNDEKFLNPHFVQDIEDFFHYDIEGHIIPSIKDKERAKYMIDLLGLNNREIVRLRQETYLSLIEVEESQGFEDVQLLLDDSQDEYSSFLTVMRKLFGM